MAGTDAERIIILDTTLRDGLGSHGAEVCLEDRVETAGMLRNLGVDVIEAGYPALHPIDRETVEEVSERVGGATICALAGADRGEIAAAGAALKAACRRRIHVYVPVNLSGLEVTEEEVLERVRSMVAYARELSEDVEWTAFGATEAPREFLLRAVEEALRGGASVIGIPDTFGRTTPEEFAALVGDVAGDVPGLSGVVLSVHCHGRSAVEKTVRAVRAGARQAECTVTGVGERGGNAALEDVVRELSAQGYSTGIDAQLVGPTVRAVKRFLGRG